jgi:hypothetical protein
MSINNVRAVESANPSLVMRSLALILTFPAVCPPATLPSDTQRPTSGLTITVLKGEGGRNSIKSRTGIPIEMEVRDNQNKSISGAQVIFHLPSFGASGSFPGGELTEHTTTGPDGHAVMTGFVPNSIEGRFNIKVTADSGILSGSAIVSEVNVAALAADKPKSHKTLWILIAVGAGGGIAAGVLAGGKGGTPAVTPLPPAPAVSVTPGAITVGGPH